MAGSATFTTVESTVTTVVPRMQATRISRLRCAVTVGPAYATALARPARPGRRRLCGNDLPGAPVEHPLSAAPLGCHYEQGPAVVAPEHAREAASVEGDRLQQLAALPRPHAVVHRTGPHRALGVQADSVGRVLELRPYAPVRKAAVRLDVERGQ